ncbi:MAG: Hsp70 family protein [Pirellulales bacterium]|nr:Hsp70 family protein [Pirellulales bacterium]
MSQTDRTPARYVVGIDLGTTNSAVTYIDTDEPDWRIRTFAVPQLVAAGQIEARDTLPSFHYEPTSEEQAGRSFQMPWEEESSGSIVGVLARDQGTMTPGRMIASAKSWLCHSGVDRTANLLPWQGAAEVARLSPVEVSGRYLNHIRKAWDAAMGDAPLAEQDVVLTLPASFDEIARELTVKAAARAGLARVVLIEEPQAAFYAWIDAHRDTWATRVEPGQKILVCDCGGGTSDFTLIRVRRTADGCVQFHRVAVGEHLILGGDNLDLALARHLEQRLVGDGRLEPRQWAVLVCQCRAVKETLLGADAPERLTVNLPGAGTRLIGGGLRVEVTRVEVAELLLEGFFPRTQFDESPRNLASGFQEFGLPFAPEPAVTRYLAAFLRNHRFAGVEYDSPVGQAGSGTQAADAARPDVVLFNGGLFESTQIRSRVLEVIRGWFDADEPGWEPVVLANERLDLAVARGAAYYGMVRRGHGVRIAAGLARTYYIGVESERPSAVCLVPAGAEPGGEIAPVDREFRLLVSTPVEFPLLASSTRLTDAPGEVVAIDREQMTPLPPIRTVLRKRRKGDADEVSVRLHAALSEIGTLELWCEQVDGPGRWRLQFDVRSTTETDRVAHASAAEAEGFLDESVWESCRERIVDTFGPDAKEKPARLVKHLAEAVGASRHEWPASLLRRMGQLLLEEEAGRRRSPLHEARWLNLLGFALRPGYGLAADDWRVGETWRRLQGNLVHSTVMCRAEWWILWRRIAGGLTAGQQRSLADPVLGPLRAMHRQMTTGKGSGGQFTAGSHETAEVWRLLGSLELLDTSTKIELGGMLLDLLPKPRMAPVRPSMGWAVGRIGARRPVYGPLNTVVPSEVAVKWLRRVMDAPGDEPLASFAVMELARRTDDRYRDLPDKARAEVVRWLQAVGAPDHYGQLVEQADRLDTEEQGLVFGEALPKGLQIL